MNPQGCSRTTKLCAPVTVGKKACAAPDYIARQRTPRGRLGLDLFFRAMAPSDLKQLWESRFSAERPADTCVAARRRCRRSVPPHIAGMRCYLQFPCPPVEMSLATVS